MINKVALITGGARGIGRAVALDLAARGWSVAICYRTSAKEANEVIDAVKTHGVGASALQCDVSDPQAAVEWVQRVNQQWGRIDALINSAGPYHRVSLLDETNEGWHSMFDNNLHPVFYLSKAVIPIMKERKVGTHHLLQHGQRRTGDRPASAYGSLHHQGRLAGAGTFPCPARGSYGITVNAISPGFIDSGSAPKAELEAAAKRIPAGYRG